MELRVVNTTTRLTSPLRVVASLTNRLKKRIIANEFITLTLLLMYGLCSSSPFNYHTFECHSQRLLYLIQSIHNDFFGGGGTLHIDYNGSQ